MATYVNVRYSLTLDEATRLEKVQQYLQRKLRITKVSQTDALRHMLETMEQHIAADNVTLAK